MELNRLQKLAGLPITEAVQLNEASKSEKVEIHFSPKGPGQMGDVLVIEGGATMVALAKMFKLSSEWKLTQVTNGVYAAHDGERLTFFTHKSDFIAEDE